MAAWSERLPTTRTIGRYGPSTASGLRHFAAPEPPVNHGADQYLSRRAFASQTQYPTRKRNAPPLRNVQHGSELIMCKQIFPATRTAFGLSALSEALTHRWAAGGTADPGLRDQPGTRCGCSGMGRSSRPSWGGQLMITDSPIRSGDRLFVVWASAIPERSWTSRNVGLVGMFVAATAAIVAFGVN